MIAAKRRDEVLRCQRRAGPVPAFEDAILLMADVGCFRHPVRLAQDPPQHELSIGRANF